MMIICCQLGYVLIVSPVERLWPFTYKALNGETISRVTEYGEMASFCWGWDTVIVSLLIILMTIIFTLTVDEPGE